MDASSRRIDAHQHFWTFNPETHAWITPEMQTIRNDFRPVDLWPNLQEARMDGCVAVQVDQNIKETLTLLRLADENPFIKGVVGWIDLRDSKLDDQLSFFQQHKKLKGFRHIVQSEADGFLLQPSFLKGIEKLAGYGYTYDILIYPRQLPEAIQFVRKFPHQRFILDHMAKPLIKNRTLQPWKKDIAALAVNDNVVCKVSGMVTEADWVNWMADDFRPYLDVILECFGTKRMIYGSDWPVCLIAASYQRQISIVEKFIESLTLPEQRGIMGGNAIQFYNL